MEHTRSHLSQVKSNCHINEGRRSTFDLLPNAPHATETRSRTTKWVHPPFHFSFSLSLSLPPFFQEEKSPRINPNFPLGNNKSYLAYYILYMNIIRSSALEFNQIGK